MREIIDFNSHWSFLETDLKTREIPDILPNASWKPVRTPHDWLIGNSRDLYRDGIGWYRKSFDAPIDGVYYLEFDGVYMDCTVYINGHVAYEWKYGYTGFTINITDYIRPISNEIFIRCIHQAPNSRWYTGAGIYRNVRLIRVSPTHFLPHSIYIHSEPDGDDFTLQVSVETSDRSCASACPSEPVILNRLINASGHCIGACEGGCTQNFRISSPETWSPDHPTLYTLVSSLIENGQCVDEISTSLGFRTLHFDPDRGLYLNGEPLKIRGVCQHHDLGALGAAVNEDAIVRQLSIIKEMGANAVRASHNPMSPEFMNACDRMGLMVMSEFTDIWRTPKTEFDYARFFDEWSALDVKSWISRDRNHPCVIMWSIGNEIHDTHAGPGGRNTLQFLLSQVRLHDPLENAPITFCSNYMPWENTQKCADITKLIGYNYAEKYYAAHHESHPEWIIFGSETGSLAQSRGVYHFPLSASILADDDMQCSALGNSRTSWGAKSIEQCIFDDCKTPFSAGHFIWSGFDYLGEPTPYHSKSSYLGHIDTAGFPKDSYYIIKAAWTSFQDKPMIHLFPYWDFCEGQPIDVRICSNAPIVELFLNRKSLGIRNLIGSSGHTLIANYLVPYEKGVLEAVAYDSDGRERARSVRRSFGDAARLCLSSAQTVLRSGHRNLAFIEISATDLDGHPVDNANNRVGIIIQGAGQLVGIDNGNSADFDSFKGSSMRLFNGRLLAIIEAGNTPGDILIKVRSRGLASSSLRLPVIDGTGQDNLSDIDNVRPQSDDSVSLSLSEIPIRKIELFADTDHLSATTPTTSVRYRLHPGNTTYNDLLWRVTDARGVDSSVAEIRPIEGGAVVSAKGDGTFFVRCLCHNGGVHPYLYASIPFVSEGLGQLQINPYQYVSGGTYTQSGGDIGNGNERGFSTARDHASYVGFDNLDFGKAGADSLCIDIFCLDSAPLPVELWLGMPDSPDSQLVDTLIYNKPSQWNIYQRQCFSVPGRISGVHDVYFRFARKCHVRGFIFTMFDKEFSRIPAADCDAISGDAYTRTKTQVTGITNNVTLSFLDMDFKKKGAAEVIISGRTPLPKTNIQLRFRHQEDDTETVYLFEFKGSADADSYTDQSFVFDRIYGLYDIHVIFLPGSRFDFDSIQFT